MGWNINETMTPAENQGKWYERPLGLPVGSVRALIALFTVVTASYIILGTSNDVPEWFQAVIAVIIGFYFGKKT